MRSTIANIMKENLFDQLKTANWLKVSALMTVTEVKNGYLLADSDVKTE